MWWWWCEECGRYDECDCDEPPPTCDTGKGGDTLSYGGAGSPSAVAGEFELRALYVLFDEGGYTWRL